MYTKEEKFRQGAAVYLSLKGKARDVVRGLSTDTLKADDGVEKIIAELDKVFQTDKVTQAYCAFKDFADYRRSSGDGFSTFIVEFEKRHRELVKFDMALPTGVQAFFCYKQPI